MADQIVMLYSTPPEQVKKCCWKANVFSETYNTQFRIDTNLKFNVFT